MSASWKTARYQPNVQPVIGNVPYWFRLKLNRTSSAIGANRNAYISIA